MMMQLTLKRKFWAVFVSCFFLYFIGYLSSNSELKIGNRSKFKHEKSFRIWVREELIDNDRNRVGAGENGAEFHLTDPEEILLNKKLYQETGFSVVVSDHISVNRSLPQVVHPDCLKVLYAADLPTVSVIIIFHNEVKSVLLRTIHSIINRTPPELLEEIILVNDNSSNVELYGPLRQYVDKNFSSKVKIKELKKRSGLIVARMEGARKAVGNILVFFDSHVEVHFNWLPPLIEPLVQNKRIATLPIIDYFDPFTFGYLPDQETFQGARGVIDWYLDYHELPKRQVDQNNDLHSFPNPIMLGCGFAIDRRFFLDELKGYDEGLQIWNGENYELSFKLWMCADGLISVPCSRVAHSFRSINPSRKMQVDYVARNFMRISEVWLDEYKSLPKQLEPERYKNVDPGDLTMMKTLRKQLNCRSFDWYIKNVALDMIERYPPFVDPPKFASGSVQNLANPRLCLDNLGQPYGERLGVVQCSKDVLEPGANQKFLYSLFKDIRQDIGRHKFCLDAWQLSMAQCNHLPFGNQYWRYDHKSKEVSLMNPEKKCLTLQITNDTIHMENCNNELTQKWNFGFINETAMNNFNEIFGYKTMLNL